MTRAACAIAITLQSALLTACTEARPQAAPAVPVSAMTVGVRPVSNTEARRAYDRYLRLGDRTYAGLALEISRARPEPFPPGDVRFIIPRPLPGSPRWFLASTVRAQLIFQETRAGWRVVAGSATPAGYRLPEPALDPDGHAMALDEHATGLYATPRQVAHAHAISLASMHLHPQARAVLAPGTHTSDAARDLQAEQALTRGQWALSITTHDLPALYALRTKDGGALTWYGIRETQTYTPVADPHTAIRFSRPVLAALSRGRAFVSRAVIKAAGSFVAVIPPAGATAKAAVAGGWYATTSINGS
ncbi:hypothetical protein [Spongiactinospora sp. 9N601]|uniref:hypothetical protein n=1 Tax=Spongiactinospora sp. 9N601 TaxID=3375149 RepID=UPI0037AE075A